MIVDRSPPLDGCAPVARGDEDLLPATYFAHNGQLEQVIVKEGL